MAAPADARKTVEHTPGQDLPPHAEEEAAGEAARVWAETEKIRYRALRQVTRVYARGELARLSGCATLEEWVTRTLRMSPSQARELSALALRFSCGEMVAAGAAFEEGVFSLGEAVAVIHPTVPVETFLNADCQEVPARDDRRSGGGRG